MAYARIGDMVLRFGESEMIRASTPDGAAATAIVPAPIIMALDDASAEIDTYLRKRYRVPLDVAPKEINKRCCDIARYQLSMGGERMASEQTKDAYKQALDWLKLVADGRVVLDLAEVAPGDESFATMRHRHDQLSERGDENGFDGYLWGGGFS